MLQNRTDYIQNCALSDNVFFCIKIPIYFFEIEYSIIKSLTFNHLTVIKSKKNDTLARLQQT